MTRGPIDISRTIRSNALVYPGDPPPGMRRRHAIREGSPFNVLELAWTTHLLTHLDAPLHFFDDGAAVSEIPVERLVGDALVVAVDGPEVLREHVPDRAEGLNLLFRTRHSGPWDAHTYDTGHVYIGREAAEAMAARRVNLAGIDYLDVERHGDEAYPVHRTLLGAGVLVLEGLDLAGAAPGRYTLIALPLKIADGDGSPVRAVLMPLE